MRPLREPTPEEVAVLCGRLTVGWDGAAKLLGVGVSSLRAAVRRGELDLRVVRVGRRVVIPTAAVLALLGEGG